MLQSRCKPAITHFFFIFPYVKINKSSELPLHYYMNSETLIRLSIVNKNIRNPTLLGVLRCHVKTWGLISPEVSYLKTELYDIFEGPVENSIIPSTSAWNILHKDWILILLIKC